MVCVQVFGNDHAVAFAGSQGNFQLNVYKPVMLHNVMESAQLLADACLSFEARCARGIEPNEKRIAEHGGVAASGEVPSGDRVVARAARGSAGWLVVVALLGLGGAALGLARFMDEKREIIWSRLLNTRMPEAPLPPVPGEEDGPETLEEWHLDVGAPPEEFQEGDDIIERR